MKVLVVLFAVCVASSLGRLTDDQLTHLRRDKEACIAETGVDAAVVENAKNGQIAETDEKLKCFAACLLKKIGIMDAQGGVHEDVARAQAPSGISQEKLDDVVNRCKGLKGSNDCETGGALLQCFLREKSFNLLS